VALVIGATDLFVALKGNYKANRAPCGAQAGCLSSLLGHRALGVDPFTSMTHGQRDAIRPVTFLAVGHHRPLTDISFISLGDGGIGTRL